jgi:hypothetical protein
MPFEPKPNMTIAPLTRRQDLINMTDEQHEEFMQNLDNDIFGEVNLFRFLYLIKFHRLNFKNSYFKSSGNVVTYLKEIKNHPEIIKRQKATCRRR